VLEGLSLLARLNAEARSEFEKFRRLFLFALFLVRKRALWDDSKTRAHLTALRERQPRRKAGVRKATGLLTREVAGLPNGGGL
jgi:hypothetical protein